MEKVAGIGKILIVAGGTGGHIFPALAFGHWILEHKKAGRVLYVSGSRPLEIDIYASQNISPYRLPLAGSPLGSSSVWRNFRRWMGLFYAFWQAGRFLIRERPDQCFLFGSYVSLMPLLWCCLLKIHVVFHEQNARAGKVTRLASRLGVPIASGWSECRGLGKIFSYVGIPVRPLKKMPRREAAAALGVEIKGEDVVIGIAGGSLSSASLTVLVERISSGLSGAKKRNCVFIVLSDAAASLGTRVHFIGRWWDMNPFYSLCDVVICRSGASTLAELAVYGIPALTVPWKGAADGHQEANARCFADLTGNFVWIEGNEGENGGEDELEEKLSKLLERSYVTKSVKSEDDFATDKASLALWRVGRRTAGARRAGYD